MIVRLIIYICLVIIYTSCKNNNIKPDNKTSTDTFSKSEETIVRDSLPQKDSIKNYSTAPHMDADKINSKQEFDPKKEPSSIIPKHPVMRQMPLPGGVPDKHYIDSIKNARSKK